MNKQIDYQKFSQLEDATHLIDLLNIHQIHFSIDDSAMRFDMTATSLNPLDSGIVIQIREIDKDKVDKLLKNNVETSVNEHYMYTLSDNDIIDAVVNHDEWTKEEHVLAQEIFKQRKLVLSGETIKSSRREIIENEKIKELKQKSLINGGASWFLWIGVLSALNIVALIFNQNFQFIAGLGINYVILGMTEGILQSTGIDLKLWAYIFTILISGIFLLIWKKSKEENKAIYLIGLIVYGLDTIIFIFAKEWLSLGFHVFALLMLTNGYNALIAKKKAKINL